MSRLAPLSLALLLAACTTDIPEETPEDVAGDEVAETPPALPTPPTPPPGATDDKPAKPVPTALPADAPASWTDPSLAQETAPETFTCTIATNEGSFSVKVTRAWAPHGADRFYNLCKINYFAGARFFRNVEGFMVQWGMSAYPEANAVWEKATILDDPVVKSNTRHMVTFAKTNQPDSRSTQIFISHGDNSNLDEMGFAPFGEVAEGADVIDKLYTGYGEGAPRGRGPNQGIIGKFGEAYLADMFPELDKIERTTVSE